MKIDCSKIFGVQQDIVLRLSEHVTASAFNLNMDAKMGPSYANLFTGLVEKII